MARRSDDDAGQSAGPSTGPALPLTRRLAPGKPRASARPGSGSSPGSPPAEFDRYALVKLLGKGGMGNVYHARHEPLGRDVAIKFIAGPDADLRRRFQLEARAAARFHHPNIAVIYDYGQVDGQPYLVEEYVRGESLRRVLDDRGEKPLPWMRVAELGLALARGLAEVHRSGVIHRDIKPDNVIIAENGEPKLVDFGVAKLMSSGAGRRSDCDGDSDGDSDGDGDGDSGPTRLTRDGAQVGTLRYMAPEVLGGDAATPRSDVYSLGVMLFELCTGRRPHDDVPRRALPAAVLEHDAPSLASLAPEVDTRLAAAVDRCLARDPGARHDSGEALRDALEAIHTAEHPALVLDENPYRGLLPFDAEHRALFFGREAEARAVLERLRAHPMVIIVGGSGVGKSSLARAGVLPLVGTSKLDRRPGWRTCVLVPGRRPLHALAAALCEHLDVAAVDSPGDVRALERELHDDLPAASARLERALAGDGLAVLVDQLEELITVSRSDQAAATIDALLHLCTHVSGLRWLATVRDDRLMALVEQIDERAGGAPDDRIDITRYLYLLRPLGPSGVREVIVEPVRAMGYGFESNSTIETLIRFTTGTDGALPLLQFTLAQLWDHREPDRRHIPARALESIGGVEGALSRHADRVLDRMVPATRRAARDVLGRLVTVDGLRVPRPESELMRQSDREGSTTDGTAPVAARTGSGARDALDALIRGRLVIARRLEGQPIYEIAHEALVTSWETLRRWLDRSRETRAMTARIAAAAEEWTRVGRARSALWRGSSLQAVAAIAIGELPPASAAFLAASRRRARRARWIRGASPVLVLVLIAAAYAGMMVLEQRETRARARELIGHAANELGAPEQPGTLRMRSEALYRLREAASTAFQRGDQARGEQIWREVLDRLSPLDDAYTGLLSRLEAAVRLFPDLPEVEQALASALFEYARFAGRTERPELRDRLRARLEIYDADGTWSRWWTDPREVSVATGRREVCAALASADDRAPGEDGAVRRSCTTPLRWQIPPGSYIITFEIGAGKTVRYPFRLPPGEDLERSIPLPRPEQIPPGFVYVPAGVSLLGFGRDGDAELMRRSLTASPLLETHVARPYLIAAHETTVGQYIEFLNTLPPEERDLRLPRSLDPASTDQIDVVRRDGVAGGHELGAGFGYRLRRSGGIDYQPRPGEPFIYLGREGRNSRQDWTRFPVTSVSFTDARAYARWLASTGEVHHADLCSDEQWERAARGADGRVYPHGARLDPDDANIDRTYGQITEAFGPDEVGLHPGSRSPFGVDDMVGNAWEMTRPTSISDVIAIRGGSYYVGGLSILPANRATFNVDQRDPHVGFRICAALPGVE